MKGQRKETLYIVCLFFFSKETQKTKITKTIHVNYTQRDKSEYPEKITSRILQDNEI